MLLDVRLKNGSSVLKAMHMPIETEYSCTKLGVSNGETAGIAMLSGVVLTCRVDLMLFVNAWSHDATVYVFDGELGRPHGFHGMSALCGLSCKHTNLVTLVFEACVHV